MQQYKCLGHDNELHLTLAMELEGDRWIDGSIDRAVHTSSAASCPVLLWKLELAPIRPPEDHSTPADMPRTLVESTFLDHVSCSRGGQK